jgi:hypothetical protein
LAFTYYRGKRAPELHVRGGGGRFRISQAARYSRIKPSIVKPPALENALSEYGKLVEIGSYLATISEYACHFIG